MSEVSIGDMARHFLLQTRNTAMKAEANRLLGELTTGKRADIGKAVAGDFKPLAAIESSLLRLQGFRTAATEAGHFAQSMQDTLSLIDTMSADAAPGFLAASGGGNATMVNSTAQDARQKFATVVSALNTRVADRTLFAGDAANAPAIAAAETMLAELMTLTTGETTATGVEAIVDTWFDDPLGFGTAGYLGGGAAADLRISETEAARLDITAADPAIRDTLKGFAMAALLDAGALGGQDTARSVLLRTAGERLMQAGTDRAHLAARLGTQQEMIDAVGVRNATQTLALEQARNAIVAVDPYEAAATLEETQTQLETLYALTARLSKLSLVDFLR
ncbi:MAG: flagellin [Paracoccaceae bacterium]